MSSPITWSDVWALFGAIIITVWLTAVVMSAVSCAVDLDKVRKLLESRLPAQKDASDDSRTEKERTK